MTDQSMGQKGKAFIDSGQGTQSLLTWAACGRHRVPRRSVFLLFCLLILVPSPLSRAGESFSAEGITEPFLDVTLSASVSGIISVEKFKEGEFVKEGEIILELDKRLEELETMRRKVVLDTRKTDFEATQVLFKNTKSVSKEEMDKKEADYKIAQVEHDAAVEQLRRRLITAPFSGVITELALDVGEACQPYQPLLRLVDTRQCYFISNIEAKWAAPLKLGQAVKLQVQTGAEPIVVQGKIIFLSPVVDPGSGLLKVKVLFENPEGKVRPGLTARMVLE